MSSTATKRPDYFSIAWQLLLDNLLRLRFQLAILAWVCFFVPTVAIVSSYFGNRNVQSFGDSVENIAPIVTPVTFYIAALISAWGLWTRDSATSFPSRYFLLPVSTTAIVISTLVCQLLLCVLAVLVGLLTPMLLGLDLQLRLTLPLYVLALIFGILVNWCRTEIRFLGYLLLLMGFGISSVMFYDYYSIGGSPASITLLYYYFVFLAIAGLIVVGVSIIRSQRIGRFYGFKYFMSLLHAAQAKFESRNLGKEPPTTGFQLFDNWNSKLAMFSVYDLRRIFFPSAILIVVANLLNYAILVAFDLGVFTASLGILFSIAVILIASLLHAIRSRSPENEIRSHISVLPVSDKSMGFTWLFNLWLNYGLSVIVLFCSLSPVMLYMLTQQHAPIDLNIMATVRFIISPLIVLSLINVLLTIGRSSIITKVFLAVLSIVMVAAFAAVMELHWLQYTIAIVLSVAIFATYILIVIASIKTNTFVLWANGLLLITSTWQLTSGYEWMFGSSIYETKFVGLVFLPVMPFVLAPLGTYLNRHR